MGHPTPRVRIPLAVSADRGGTSRAWPLQKAPPNTCRMRAKCGGIAPPSRGHRGPIAKLSRGRRSTWQRPRAAQGPPRGPPGGLQKTAPNTWGIPGEKPPTRRRMRWECAAKAAASRTRREPSRGIAGGLGTPVVPGEGIRSPDDHGLPGGAKKERGEGKHSLRTRHPSVAVPDGWTAFRPENFFDSPAEGR